MGEVTVSSWGNVFHERHALYSLRNRHDPFPDSRPGLSILPFGNGRSYGDSCLNGGNALLQMRALDRYIDFERTLGVLRCESGVLLRDLLDLILPHGWYLPVVPGTAYATVGGSIANDVHGKNHHSAGTFGCHVRSFELLRSSGERMQCSPTQNPEWFRATVGGLGLTGAITWAELQLRTVPGSRMDVEVIRFDSLREFFELSAQSERAFEYTVAWIDCLAGGKRLGRGLFQRANHARGDCDANSERRLSMPPVPVSLVTGLTLRLFNTLYYYRQRTKVRRTTQSNGSFFFPLDSILNWNRLYGRRGFYQYQCVIPNAASASAMTDLLATISRAGQGSFLAVLKRFGAHASPGLLSFPIEGATLALDFPNRGSALERLFRELDAIVAAHAGRLYPAKDGRMPGALFRSGYPRWREFSQYIDPAFSSSFWRRVTEGA